MSKDDKKQEGAPSEKDLDKLTKKVDKLVTKAQKKQVEEMLSGSSTSSSEKAPSKKEAEMRAQLQNMLKNLALMEEAGLLRSGAGGKKSMADHKFWSTQPVPQHGKSCAHCNFFFHARKKARHKSF